MYVLRASLSTQQPTWTFIWPHMYAEGEPEYEHEHEHELFEDIYSQDLECPSLYLFRCPFITYPGMKSYKIVGVSKDLLLYGPCKNVGHHCLYNICNPITRQWISLPPCTHCADLERIGFVTHVENGVLSSHRVVRMEVPLKRSNFIRFLVFISETSEWKELDVYTEQEILGAIVRNPAMLNGIIHWVTERREIMAYDPYQKPNSLRLIALPRDVNPILDDRKRAMGCLCDAYEGRLRYFESPCNDPRGFSNISVWILNDYSSGDWCLQHRISSVDIIYDDILPIRDLFLRPMFFHPFDPEIVYLGDGNTIISYNIKTRKLESHSPTFRYPLWWWSWATFLFVVPPWPTSIAPSSSGVAV